MSILENDKDISKIEKRKLSKCPKIPKDIEEIKKFPMLFDAYFSDHFGLRYWFTKYHKLIKYYLGDSPSTDVIIGKDGWMFLGSIKRGYNKYSDPIGDFRGSNLYSQNDLKNFAYYMMTLRSWLKARGIEYVFVIAPNKHTVYFDKLPDYISKTAEQSATDMLVGYLKKHTDVPVVDLRSKLINEKGRNQLYYKTDTHWNHYAANIIQYEIMSEIEKIFPNRIEPEMVNLRDGTRGGGDLAYFLGIDDIIESKESNPQPVFDNSCTIKKIPANAKETETHTLICETEKLSAVIFRDSFFSTLQPYFSRKFKRSTYIWKKLNYSSLITYIESENPDIVIEEWIERSLPFVPKFGDEFRNSLNKEFYGCSDELIFSNDFKTLKFNTHINLMENTNSAIKLKSIGKDPIISFPILPFENGNKYIIYVKIESSINSTLQVFYSDSNKTGYPFSENKSVRKEIKSGSNDIYIPIEEDSLGKHLRLDPISGAGEVTIQRLEIKKIKNTS